MGITVFKIFIWGGKSSDIRSEIFVFDCSTMNYFFLTNFFDGASIQRFGLCAFRKASGEVIDNFVEERLSVTSHINCIMRFA